MRFVVECQIKIDASENQPSRFSNSFLFQTNKKPLVKKFYIQLKENGENSWILSSIDPFEENLEPMQSSSFNQKFKSFSKMVRSTSSISFDLEDDITDEPSESGDLEEDEPLASGTGEVSKDCSQDRLDCWEPVIVEWQSTGKRPKNLASLIRQGGIPEALRCQLWQKLSYTDSRTDSLTDKYRMLIAQVKPNLFGLFSDWYKFSFLCRKPRSLARKQFCGTSIGLFQHMISFATTGLGPQLVKNFSTRFRRLIPFMITKLDIVKAFLSLLQHCFCISQKKKLSVLWLALWYVFH